jgi:signal peptidase I
MNAFTENNYKTGWFSGRAKRNFIDSCKNNKKFLLFLFLLFVVRTTFINWNFIPSASMNPGLVEGDFVIVNKLNYDVKIPFFGTNFIKIKDPVKGEVIAFHKDGQLLVKRVMAVSGDKVRVVNNSFYVNGVKLNIKNANVDLVDNKQLPYSNKFKFSAFNETNVVGDGKKKSYDVVYAIGLPKKLRDSLVVNTIEYTVPEGTYFMIGDNRNLSRDSRYFGPVERDAIVGKVSYILFNYSQLWSRISGGDKLEGELRLFSSIN